MKKVLAKKNNKGFSLVELIVVILIMAIIGVALAPQVMKWVGESKKSTDADNKATITSAVNAGVADYMKDNALSKGTTVVYFVKKDTGLVDNTGKAINLTTDKLAKAIDEVMNGTYPGVQDDTTKSFKISITDTGKVTVETDTTPAVPAAPGT